MILHITQASQWEQAKVAGLYQPESLATEGFVHCSRPDQVVKVANAFFFNQPGLVLLCLQPDKVQAEIRYEAADGDEFPHIYGPLNLDAVVQVLPFEPGVDGRFELPRLLVDGLSQAGRSGTE